MASTVGMRYVTGTVIALNANLDIRKVGGKPRKIRVVNQTNQVQAEWNEELPEGYAYKILADGTLSVETSNGFSLLDGSSTEPPGFRLGALADVNDTTTEILKYEAWI